MHAPPFSRFTPACAVSLLLPFLVPAASATNVVVSAFRDGVLHWTNTPPQLQMFSIEWLPTMASNTWQVDWSRQACVITTQAVESVPVPMCYRVARGFDDRAFAGLWMIYHANGFTHLRADGAGLLHEFGATRRSPVGEYSVQTNGAFTAVIFDNDAPILISGQCVGPHTWRYVYQTSTGVIRRIANPGALAGTWRGTIGPYTNVILLVRSNGTMPIVSNLIDVASGCAYADESNNVTMAIFTGADPCTSVWARVDIRGTLINATNIIGDYDLDWSSGWITAGVHLRRP